MSDEDYLRERERIGKQGIVVDDDTQFEGFEPVHGTFFIEGCYRTGGGDTQHFYPDATLTCEGDKDYHWWQVENGENSMSWETGEFFAWKWDDMHPERQEDIRKEWKYSMLSAIAHAVNLVRGVVMNTDMPEELEENLLRTARELNGYVEELDAQSAKDCLGG